MLYSFLSFTVFLCVDTFLHNFTSPFPTKLETIPNFVLRKTTDPLALDFHMTRYYMRFGGLMPPKEPSYYSHLIPWIRMFDLVIEPCGRNQGICVYCYRSSPNFNTNATIRIHVLNNYENHYFFINKILPFFELRYNTTYGKIAVYSGKKSKILVSNYLCNLMYI